MNKFLYSVIFSLCIFVCASHACASDSEITTKERLSLARSFVSKIKSNLNRADKYLQSNKVIKNILEDGEILMLQPVLGDRYRVDGIIMARVHNQKILLSLADFMATLNLAVDVDPVSGTAAGWYLREDRLFEFNFAEKRALTSVGSFTISDDVLIEDGDLWIPVKELGSWIDFGLNINISSQEMEIETDVPLPLLAKIARQNFKQYGDKIPDTSLPNQNVQGSFIAIPVVDVSTNSTYRRQGNSGASGVDAHSANINTVGNFAGGSLVTQLQLNDRDKLSSARVNYKRESLDADLLGPLKARKYEVGDVTGVTLPFAQSQGRELGFRVTNTDQTKNFSRPLTAISGTAIPGWDVELYRGSQLLDTVEIGDDGYYQFSDIILFLNDNNFKLRFYGPQGEIREEDVYVPVDRGLLSEGDGIYDVSVSLNDKSAYIKRPATGEDVGSINIAALYEKPISNGVTAIVGVRSNERGGVRDIVGNIGASAAIGQTLVNTGVAVDDEGEASANLVLRRDFAGHQFRSSFDWTAANFDVDDSANIFSVTPIDTTDGFSSAVNVNGPLFSAESMRSSYAVDSQISWTGAGDYNMQSSLGLDMGIQAMNVSGSLRHLTGSNIGDPLVDASLNLAGRLADNRLRLSANYEIAPESALSSVTASVQRDLTKNLDVEFSATKRPQFSQTEYQARLDWQAGFIRISPSVRYNSEHDFFAGLSTRFGLIKDPSTDKIRMFDENLTHMGMLSAFVYLDHNGDGIFNEDDEPLKDVVVSAPQNGRRATTDENGVALFKRMQRMKLTDVFVDNDNLPDPIWVSGFEGVSVLPREGYVAEVSFPIHLSGEIDGTIYAKSVDSEGDEFTSAPLALRNIGVSLYNDRGEVESSVVSDATGFYYFTKVPPGRYFLIIDESSARSKSFIRPEPQPIEIGYDGTVIYGNDLFVRPGEGDIPSEILADMEDILANHPDIDFSVDDYQTVLNLGEYNSRLLMSVVWYKLRSRYASILTGGDLFVPPSESYIDVAKGKHILRVGFKEDDVSDAYSRCRAFLVRSQNCKVEIYPRNTKHAQLE